MFDYSPQMAYVKIQGCAASGELVRLRSIMERFLFTISYVGTPLQYIEFKITSPEYFKN